MNDPLGRRARSLSLASLIVTLVLTACAPSSPRPQNYTPALDSDTVVMLDSKVTSQLARQKEWTETKNGFLEAHVILRNLGGRTLKVEILPYFKDENGGNLDSSLEVWDSVTINPHEDFHYSKLCPSKKGQGYQFHVRLAKE